MWKSGKSKPPKQNIEKTEQQHVEVKEKKEEARIQRDNKRAAKKQSTLSTSDQLKIIWDGIVIFIIGAWTSAKATWALVSEYMNLSMKLSKYAVESIGEGNSEVRAHNILVLSEAVKYVVMTPFYIMAGMSGVFIYKMTKPDTNERKFSIQNSFIRRMLHDGRYLYLALMTPIVYIIKWLQTSDKKAYEANSLNLASFLAGKPHIASFYIPVFLLIAFFPTVYPTLSSLIIATLYIAYCVVDNIIEMGTGVSIDERVDAAMSKNAKTVENPLHTSRSKIKGGSAMPANSSFAKNADMNDWAKYQENGSSIKPTDVQGSGKMPGGLLNMGIVGIILWIIYGLFQIAVGLLSVIPASFISGCYIWGITLFSYMLNGTAFIDVLKSLHKDSEAYAEPKSTNTAVRIKQWLVTILTNFKGLCISTICSFISLIVLLKIQSDPALAFISGGVLFLGGVSLGIFFDVIHRVLIQLNP